ncbi:hypothetical protein GQ42DRAFT_3394 [Ramicandelaber brevisporus]|nr:hypothetical protein GQ42DRAFT_3394 [Ramicandelaber brevisporus]
MGFFDFLKRVKFSKTSTGSSKSKGCLTSPVTTGRTDCTSSKKRTTAVSSAPVDEKFGNPSAETTKPPITSRMEASHAKWKEEVMERYRQKKRNRSGWESAPKPEPPPLIIYRSQPIKSPLFSHLEKRVSRKSKGTIDDSGGGKSNYKQ